jgi:hypothetical protein
MQDRNSNCIQHSGREYSVEGTAYNIKIDLTVIDSEAMDWILSNFLHLLKRNIILVFFDQTTINFSRKIPRRKV